MITKKTKKLTIGVSAYSRNKLNDTYCISEILNDVSTIVSIWCKYVKALSKYKFRIARRIQCYIDVRKNLRVELLERIMAVYVQIMDTVCMLYH